MNALKSAIARLLAVVCFGSLPVGIAWAKSAAAQNDGSIVYLKAPLPNDDITNGQETKSDVNATNADGK